jgi:hypothetical protein
MNTILRVPTLRTMPYFAFAGALRPRLPADCDCGPEHRSGPGPEHSVVGVVNADSQVTVNGCLEGSKWCTITHDGGQGWVYSDYLTADVSGTATGADGRPDSGGRPGGYL